MGTSLRRWLGLGSLALVALLYFRPLTTYMHAKSELGAQRAVVSRLEGEKATLERRLGASTSPLIVAREARSLGYVRPGEHLFIVKGIAEWRKRERASLAPRGN